MLAGLLTGWVLSFFSFDIMVIEVLESFDINATISHYYVMFALLGFLYDLREVRVLEYRNKIEKRKENDK